MTATPWAEITLHAPGYVGHETRRALARLNAQAGSPLPEAFFHYRDGYPISDSLPAIRIAGNNVLIRCTALGREGVILLYEQARTLASLIMRAHGRVPAFRLSEGELRLEHTPYERPYRVRAAALNLAPSVREVLKRGALDDAAAVGGVREVLQGALARSVQAWLPDERAPCIGEVTIERTVPVAHRGSGYRIAVTGTLRLPARLSGPWQIGCLQARGYGHLRAYRPARQG